MLSDRFCCLFLLLEDSSDEDFADAGVRDADILSEVSPDAAVSAQSPVAVYVTYMWLCECCHEVPPSISRLASLVHFLMVCCRRER